MRWIVVGVFMFFVLMYMRARDVGNMPISVPAAVAGYEKYDETVDFTALPEGDHIVLFFHADRCSSCVRIAKDIKKNWVPERIHIFEVDFDSYPDLTDTYQIRTQSSFAQIDAEWNLIKRWVGWFGIDDIVAKLDDNQQKPWDKVREEKMVDTQPSPPAPLPTASLGEGSKELKKVYFAGGCFWCMEWPYEAMDGVESAVSGYAGWSAETANYKAVWWGQTEHREAVEITYDPSKVSYAELVQTYRYQVDPTDAGGQFGDRWYQYTTAIYYSDETEQAIAQESKDVLNLSKKFDEPIAVLIEPFTTFFPAEEEHQDYYLKQSAHYNRYKKWSGRAWFIDDNRWEDFKQQEVIKKETVKVDLSQKTFEWWIGEEWLDELQRKVVFENGTEPPFDNKYRDHKEAGIYVDIIDGTPLFSSTDKFDSGTGWPSFTTPIDQLLIGTKEDRKFGMVRTEVETTNDTHLWHVFNDGPDGKQRYCINSAALDFVALEDMERLGYGEYLVLFK